MRMKGKKTAIAWMGAFILFSGTLFATPYEAYAMANTSEVVMPMAEGLIWKYKTENGILYKRLYNHTTKQWVGKWIRC